MAENPKRLSTEETWATALAVIGGLAVLVPLIVFALGRQQDAPDGAPVAPNALEVPIEGGIVERPRMSELPIPKSEAELRRQLVEARKQVDALGYQLDVAKTASEASERSAQRAWIQLREAAGEPEPAPAGELPTDGGNPG